jgi:PMP-22/EMP/MP20/Claudin family.
MATAGKYKALYLAFALTYVVVSITSTVSHCWMQSIPTDNSTTYKRIQQGLFMECVEGEDWCKNLPGDDDMPEFYLDVRALAIVSCLFSSFAAFVEILHLLFERVQRFFTTIVMLIANILLVIALGLFTSKNEYDFNVYEYGWGYILSWVAFVVGVGVVVIGFLSAYFVNSQGEFDLSNAEEMKSKAHS